MALRTFAEGQVGSLDHNMINEVTDAANRFNAMFPNAGGDPARARVRWRFKFDALSVAFQLISRSTNRWEYSWAEAEFNRTTKKWQDTSGGLTSSGFTTPAYNTVENDNNGSGIEAPGVDVDG